MVPLWQRSVVGWQGTGPPPAPAVPPPPPTEPPSPPPAPPPPATPGAEVSLHATTPRASAAIHPIVRRVTTPFLPQGQEASEVHSQSSGVVLGVPSGGAYSSSRLIGLIMGSWCAVLARHLDSQRTSDGVRRRLGDSRQRGSGRGYSMGGAKLAERRSEKRRCDPRHKCPEVIACWPTLAQRS